MNALTAIVISKSFLIQNFYIHTYVFNNVIIFKILMTIYISFSILINVHNMSTEGGGVKSNFCFPDPSIIHHSTLITRNIKENCK